MNKVVCFFFSFTNEEVNAILKDITSNQNVEEISTPSKKIKLDESELSGTISLSEYLCLPLLKTKITTVQE